MLGSNVVVKEGAFLHRAVVHDNVYVGQGVTLRGCVIGKNTDVMRLARIEEGAVVGDECVIEAEAYLSAGVKVYPFKTIEAGAVVNTSVIWESRGPAHPVRPARRVRPGQRGDHPRARGPAGQRLRHHAEEGLHRHHLAGRVPGRPRAQAGGASARSTPARSTCVDLEAAAAARWPGSRPPAATAAAASRCAPRPATRRRRHRLPGRARRRPVPGGAAQAGAGVLPAGVPAGLPRRDRRAAATRRGWWSPTPTSCCACVDMSGVREAGLKVVVDSAGGTASLVLPTLLGTIGVDVLTVNNRLDEASPTETAAPQRAGPAAAGRRWWPRPGPRSASGSTRWASGSARGREGRAGQRRPGPAGRARPGRGRAHAAAGWRCR